MPEPYLVLGLGLLISLPTIVHFVDGSLQLVATLVHFLVAIAIAWAALFIVGNVINAYLPPPPPPEVVSHALGEDDDLSNLEGYGLGDDETGDESQEREAGPTTGDDVTRGGG